MPIKRESRFAGIVAIATGLWASGATAQTWVGATSSFETAGNWSPATVPDVGNTATFTNTGVTSVSISADHELDAFSFLAGAPSFTITNTANLVFDGAGLQTASANTQTLITTGSGSFTFTGAGTAGSAALVISGAAVVAGFRDTTSASNATITINNNGTLQFSDTATAGSARITVVDADVTFFGSSSALNATIVASSPAGRGISFVDSSTAASSNLAVNNGAFLTFQDSGNAGSATITANNNAIVEFQQTSSAGSSTITTNSGGTTRFFDSSSGGSARFITNAGGAFDISGLSSAGTTAGSIEGAGCYCLGDKQLTVGSNNRSTEVSGQISGDGGRLVKVGSGTLILSGANTYSGGTTVSAGVLQGNSTSLQGDIVNNATVVFDQMGSGTYAGAMSGSGAMTLQGGGVLALTGTNTYSGATTINSGTLLVNGSITSNVTVGSAGVLGGIGTVGPVVSNGGVISPGNSIGTLTVNGNFTQNGGAYRVEANAAGQSDKVNVTGAATINGASVQLLPGIYARNGSYTILSAAGGVTGTYAGVIGSFAFLRPTLSYVGNDVILLFAQSGNLFGVGALTPNQYAVGHALDIASPSAGGDFNDVLNALASLSASAGPAALDAISGQQYAGFANAAVQGAQLFMGALPKSFGTAGAKVALAEACNTACEPTSPWSAWGGAVGGTGTMAGNGNAATFTYSLGGFAAGFDRKFSPDFLAGVAVGYLSGVQWTTGFEGRSTTDTVQVALYASYAQGPAYLDAIAGYAHSANQMWRTISFPGLQPRTASGSTSSNQIYGQLETGYRLDVDAVTGFVTPFAMLQGSAAFQDGLSESGAQSLSLNVSAQTTSSLRSVIGVRLGAALDLGWRDRLQAELRLGWSHEYADIARPVTASFAGAPAVPFTVFGASPQRDGALVGFSARTAIADATSAYVRYEGNLSGQDSSHALTAGLRMTW